MSSNTYPVFFAPAYLSDSNATVWTMPSSAASTAIVEELSLKLNNTSGATRLATIYAFTSGSASLTNAVVYNFTIPPYDYVLIPIHRISGSSAKIQGYCDVANVVTVAPIGGKLHVP